MDPLSQDRPASPDLALLASRVAGGLVAALGGIVLVGWLTASGEATRLVFSATPMLMTTALACVGIGLAMSLGESRLALRRFCALATAVIGALALLQHATSGTIDLERLLRALTPTGPVNGRMALSTAFALSAGALVLATSLTRQTSAIAFQLGLSGVTLIAFGVNILTGQLTGLDAVPLVGQVSWFATHTALAASLAGGGLLARSWSLSKSDSPAGPSWLPLLAGGCALVVGVSLWFALGSHAALLLRRSVEAQLAGAKQGVEQDVRAHARALQRMAIAWRHASALDLWTEAGQAYLVERVDHAIIAHVDEAGAIRWAAAREGGAALAGRSLASVLAAASPLAGFEGSAVRWGRADDVLGRPAFLIAAPITDGASPQGAIVAIYDLEAFCDIVLAPHKTIGLTASVGSVRLYRNAGAEATATDAVAAVTLPLGPDGLTIRATPTREALRQSRSNLPGLTLALFGAIAALLAIVASIGQRSARRLLEAERVRDHLLDALVERDMARDRQAHLTQELGRSNRELTEFASVASHDLRAPLRSVHSFVDLLAEDYGAGFDDTAHDYLRRIRGAVSRMNALIEGLLSLARVRASVEPFSTVDLNVVAREAVHDLAAAMADGGAEVIVDVLPTIEADRLQMRQLLQNLIGNALKFRRSGVAPRVTVSAKETDASAGSPRWALRVADNGIGFEPAHAERIFKPFERLHAASRYEGSGLGLAVCARIAERHGGSIRAEGALGEGAVITVFLPVRQVSGAVIPQSSAA